MTKTPTDLDQQIMISVYVRRDKHENGMTLKEYADAVIAGTQPTLDHDEFVYQFGSVADEIKLIEDWAQANGLIVIESGTGIGTVKVQGTADQFNNLFRIQLQTVVDTDRTYHTHDGDIIMPGEINSVVQAVAGLDNEVAFGHYAQIDTSTPTAIDPNVISSPTPLDLAQAYKFPRSSGTDAQQGLGSCTAIVELGGGWTTQNLTSTFGRIGLANPTVVDVLVDGGSNNPSDTSSSGEVMLDIYCVGAVAPAGKIAMYFSPNSFQGFIDCITAATNDTTNNPSVISISWGTTDTTWQTFSYLNTMETAFQAALVKGITTFVAIGDYGTQAISGGSTYTVQYPGTSPYVISAGGTIITINNDYSIASEVVWNTPGVYGTGGGISGIISIPTWQTGQSFSYTNINNVTNSLTTRGVPDVSAMATGYTFYYGSPNYSGTFVGTSAVAPLLAGMMARINQLSGRRIGFTNSDWYGVRTTAFNDIVTGNNATPNSLAGYKATSSWDACTGIGSPIGTEIFNLYNNGMTYPTENYGFRPTTGLTYPRTDIKMGL